MNPTITKQITITEALAEIKTLKARIAKQYEFVMGNIAYPSNMVDPLERSGGSIETIRRTRQSIRDMQERIVTLRVKIGAANDQAMLTVEGETRSMTAWLAWKREVGPDVRRFLGLFRQGIDQRRNATANEVNRINQKRGADSVALAVDVRPAIDEAQLAEEIEHFEKVWGDLDGQMSLMNASIRIDV